MSNWMDAPISAPERQVPEVVEGKVDTLISLLGEQLRFARQVVYLWKKRVKAIAAGRTHEVESFLDAEKDVLEMHALTERERIACLTEIGQRLGVQQPSRLRIAQLIFYTRPDQRDELLEVREDLRDVADEMESLRSWGSVLEHHTVGRVTLFIAPGVSEARSRTWLLEQFHAAAACVDPDELGLLEGDETLSGNEASDVLHDLDDPDEPPQWQCEEPRYGEDL